VIAATLAIFLALALGLLDLMLPRMSGLEFCRKLRGERIQSPVLMLTARSEEAIALGLYLRGTSGRSTRRRTFWIAKSD
jgi:DNA-binding response OmpR family regulator